ncbi:hypothetical protein D3C73_914200 [compost metagenome]
MRITGNIRRAVLHITADRQRIFPGRQAGYEAGHAIAVRRHGAAADADLNSRRRRDNRVRGIGCVVPYPLLLLNGNLKRFIWLRLSR